MATFRDLEPLTYFGPEPGSALTAVGWLGSELSFERGEVSRELFDRLRALMAAKFQPIASFGVHACELCQFDGPHGAGNLFVPAGDTIFVCPELIVHYIAAHRYLPPPVFQAAVQRCPTPGGREFRELFLGSGGRSLLS